MKLAISSLLLEVFEMPLRDFFRKDKISPTLLDPELDNLPPIFALTTAYRKIVDLRSTQSSVAFLTDKKLWLRYYPQNDPR